MISAQLPMGVEARLGIGAFPLAREPYRTTIALGGASTRPIWPGCGVLSSPFVGKSVALSSEQASTPRLQVRHLRRLWKAVNSEAHFMEYEKEIDPIRITRGLRDRVEALASTVDMIEVLIEVAEQEVRKLQDHYEANSQYRYGDWRTIYTMLRLAAQQNDIVKDVIELFSKEDVRARAA